MPFTTCLQNAEINPSKVQTHNFNASFLKTSALEMEQSSSTATIQYLYFHPDLSVQIWVGHYSEHNENLLPPSPLFLNIQKHILSPELGAPLL